MSLRSTPTSIAQASPTRKLCVSPTFANTRGPYSLNSRLTLDDTCEPDHGVLRTPTRVIVESISAPSASSTSANNVVAPAR